MGYTVKEADSKPLRILLIDDDQADRRVIRRHVGSSGVATIVEETSGAQGAIDLIRKQDFDCVLMDYRYPTGDAFELFGEVLAESPMTRPPIVLLTGHGDEQIAAESIQRGAQEYLAKSSIAHDTVEKAIRSAMERAESQRREAERDAELTHLSFYDPLTDLPNRRMLMDRLDRAILEAGRGAGFAVLMMDLNLFKEINDTYGHHAGDEVLIQVARRLTQSVRKSDTVARLGGDEFAVVLRTAESLDGALVAARKIRQAVEKPVVVDEQAISVGISIGVAMCPDHGTVATHLLRSADLALYESKRTTRGIKTHGGQGDGVSREATLIAEGLPQAVEDQQLFTLYQPMIDLTDRSVLGVEAYVRWRHPDLGLLPASRFVPAAERSEVIEQLTFEVVRKAVIDAVVWAEQGLDAPLAVNLSARLLGKSGFADEVRDLVESAGLSCDRVCFEVTEAGILVQPGAAETTLRRLSEAGFRISIDDFGTSVSSLTLLNRLPVDEIKIDRQFVTALTDEDGDTTVVESILAIGKAFGARVVAEGVETEPQWRTLVELGCTCGQGHVIGAAMDVARLQLWNSVWTTGVRG